VPDGQGVLDRMVIPGYSRLGFLLRSRNWPDSDPAAGAGRGTVVMVTGANSGIGKATTAALARLGATVLMAVRDPVRGQSARRDILAELPAADLEVVRCDVSSLADVRSVAAELRSGLERLDAVIHNAGVLPAERSESVDGHELTLATHVLGPVLLTEELTGLLAASPDPRVIFVSSGGMYTQRLPVADPQYRDGPYRGATAYARSKRIQVALTPVLAARWADRRIMVAAMHPGWVDTPGVAASLPAFRRLTAPILRTAEQGADTTVWLTTTSPPPPSGKFWHDRCPRPQHYLPVTRFTDADRDRIWRYCAAALSLRP
jgi:NAD(P)-dependent dehydrogenase (short-subunit alcohol dehydrogenase family)